MKVLIVDDKLSLTRMLQEYLGAEGYKTIVADNGRNALYTARHVKPDLVLLDQMMPEMDGITFLRLFREEANTPVIMLTAVEEKRVVVEALKAGADDYITKPFDLDELSARIEAVLRRYNAGVTRHILRAGMLELDPKQRRVTRSGHAIKLTKSEYALLYHLMAHPGRIFTRAELLNQIDSGNNESTERTIDVHVRKLRLKIEVDPKTPIHLETVFGTGYRFNRRRPD